VEQVASRHIGLNVSSGQFRFALNRLWNPRTGKGLLATLRQGKAMEFVKEALAEGDRFFSAVEEACNQLALEQQRRSVAESDPDHGRPGRSWSELRIRRPDFVTDNVTLSLQRVREAISDLIKTSDDA